jgi:hypothetical protein
MSQTNLDLTDKQPTALMRLEAVNDFKPSKKHLAIFKTIAEKGFYKPTYSDKEPATVTLEKKGIVEWRGDYKGVVLTEYGKELINLNGW